MDAVNRPALVPLQAQLAGPVRTASLILMGGVALLLLLACANVANLLLGRTVARSSELMIRTALGASRARLTQQLLTEALVLSLAATAAGLVVARWTSALATAVQPAQLSSQAYTILDWRVLVLLDWSRPCDRDRIRRGTRGLRQPRRRHRRRAQQHARRQAHEDPCPPHRDANRRHCHAPDRLDRARACVPRAAVHRQRVRNEIDRDLERLAGGNATPGRRAGVALPSRRASQGAAGPRRDER